MTRTLRLLLALVVSAALLASATVQAAPVGRGGVTPANIPWNKHPLPKTTASFEATPAGRVASTTSTAAKLALIVGISDYSGDSSDLEYCDDDALEVYSTLIGEYGFTSSDITLLLDSDATHANILAGIDWLVANAGPDTHVVFYYSGHGSRSTRDADGDAERRDECIIPWELSRLWDGELATRFAPLASGSVWIAFDSCYSGGMTDIADAAPDGKVVTMACGEKQYSYESSSIEHGYFTWLMVEIGMRLGEGDANGDGVVTVEEAFAFCAANIDDYVRQQDPVMDDGFAGELVP